jgi:hypothetical protein
LKFRGGGLVSEDPERLLAEALRLQAARTPIDAPATSPRFGGYGLLSGSEHGLTLPVPAEPTVATTPPAEQTRPIEPTRRLAAGRILLLAVLLGLATGAIVGLVTLI